MVLVTLYIPILGRGRRQGEDGSYPEKKPSAEEENHCRSFSGK